MTIRFREKDLDDDEDMDKDEDADLVILGWCSRLDAHLSTVESSCPESICILSRR